MQPARAANRAPALLELIQPGAIRIQMTKEQPKNAEAELVILERIAVCAKNYLICRRRQMDSICAWQNAMVSRKAAGGDRPGPAEGQADIDRREATGQVMKAVADLTQAVDMLENCSSRGSIEQAISSARLQRHHRVKP